MHTGVNRHGRAFGLAALVLATFVGCGGGESGGASPGAGGSGGGGGTQTGTGLPTRLPEDAGACAAATGSDGCFFDRCCTELVACSENAACATVFACYTSCPSDDSDCFANCASPSLEDGAEDFGTALGCAAPAGVDCGGSMPMPDGGTEPPTDVGPLGSAEDALGWNLLVSDNPLTAELEPDIDRAVSEEIPLEGGTLTATAADGTVFELTIPDGALYGPTVLTLTPLSSLSVSGIDGVAYGAQIEPDGLPLMGAPTLAITPPDDVEWPLDEQLPLAITGEDQHVSLALVDPESEPLRLTLTHFSSYAVLLSQKGLDATLSEGDIRARLGGSEEERLQSAVAERLERRRSDGVNELGLDDLSKEYDEHVLKPRVEAAGSSCAAGRFAITSLLTVDRQEGLLGTGYQSRYWYVDLIPTVADVCMREEFELCRDEHIITRVLPAYFAYLRQSSILGLGTEVEGMRIPPAWLLEAEDYAKRCLQFELQLDSTVTYSDDSPATSMSETVTARVPIGLQATLALLPVDALPPGAAPIGALILGPGQPLESTAYQVGTQEACRTIDEELPEAGELLVSYMTFTPSGNSPDTVGGSTEISDVGLSLALVQNLSSYLFTQQTEETVGCGDVTANGNEVLSWSTTLGAYLLEVSTTVTDGAYLTDWLPVNSDIIATKDLTLSTSDGGSSTRGPVHLVLFHTPM
jgi:hypothetical protein